MQVIGLRSLERNPKRLHRVRTNPVGNLRFDHAQFSACLGSKLHALFDHHDQLLISPRRIVLEPQETQFLQLLQSLGDGLPRRSLALCDPGRMRRTTVQMTEQNKMLRA